MTDDKETIRELLFNSSSDTQAVTLEVIRLEKQKLHMKNPIGIVDDIIGVIKALIK